MDQEPRLPMNGLASADRSRRDPAGFSRRRLLKCGAAGLASAGCCGALAWYFSTRARAATAAEVFRGDAPTGQLWELWQKRGWVREARHYLKLGRNVQCKLCPNECLLAPEDRSRCRDRVNKEGTLYTLAYGNPTMPQADPVEKKPLYHFLPGSYSWSFATAGCGFRCLNCQNWSLSQRRPEELKDPRGDPVEPDARHLQFLTADDLNRMSIFPGAMVAMAEYFDCRSIAYTYSEPTVWFEYMLETAKAARAKKLRNIWVTCGYIQQEPLAELCQYLDAAHVDLKGFSDETYGKLNSGKLAPILATLKRLRREGVWFEVINLVVPTYTDDLATIRQMCRWLVDNLGPDCPLHFSRFHPEHKLTQLQPTPKGVLSDARAVAREEGLRYVYVGNCCDVADAGTTFCPGCGRVVIERTGFSVTAMHLAAGKCDSCRTPIAGVWT
ncbi:MAG: AmmeMemoRadiSam system radical SAM enzyme [Thermoguttaceae bacterium]|jgi:pyruvate formate lyase activating enzyme